MNRPVRKMVLERIVPGGTGFGANRPVTFASTTILQLLHLAIFWNHLQLSKKIKIGSLGFILFFYRDKTFIKLDHNFVLLKEYQCTVRGESLHEKACFFNAKKKHRSVAHSPHSLSAIWFFATWILYFLEASVA